MGLLNEDASLLLAAPVSQSEPSGQGAGPSAPAVLGERFSQICVTLTALPPSISYSGSLRAFTKLHCGIAPPGGRTVGKWEAGG